METASIFDVKLERSRERLAFTARTVDLDTSEAR
jgi:hypothetical protein